MKTVFSNDMCAHVWAQLSQPFGRSGSMKFDGALAYSYHQPVAHLIVPFGKSRPVLLVTPCTWSVTTSHHVSLYRRAASQYDEFMVPDLFEQFRARLVRDEQSTPETHAENLKYLREQFDKLADSLMRCPADSYKLSHHETYQQPDGHGAKFGSFAHEYLQGAAERFTAYCEAFGLEQPALDWSAALERINARRDRLLNDPKRAAKRAAAAAARERAAERKAAAEAEQRRIALLETAEQVTLWRNGADVRLPWNATRDESGGAMLRIRGDVVETSLGATVPIDHARRVMRFYRRLRAHGMCSSNTQHEARADVTLGHFTLDSIAEDGSVRAGCHYITATEIDRLYSIMGEQA